MFHFSRQFYKGGDFSRGVQEALRRRSKVGSARVPYRTDSSGRVFIATAPPGRGRGGDGGGRSSSPSSHQRHHRSGGSGSGNGGANGGGGGTGGVGLDLSSPMLRRLATSGSERTKQFEAALDAKAGGGATSSSSSFSPKLSLAAMRAAPTPYEQRKRERQRRQRRRFNQAQSEDSKNPSLHPCLRQLGACPDPVLCAFRHVPAEHCLNVLRFGFCRGAQDGTCTFEHSFATSSSSSSSSSSGAGDRAAGASSSGFVAVRPDSLVRLLRSLVKRGQREFKFTDVARFQLASGSGGDAKHKSMTTTVMSNDSRLRVASSSGRDIAELAHVMESEAEKMNVATAAAPSDALQTRAQLIADIVQAHHVLFVRTDVDPSSAAVDPRLWQLLCGDRKQQQQQQQQQQQRQQRHQMLTSDANLYGAFFSELSLMSDEPRAAVRQVAILLAARNLFANSAPEGTANSSEQQTQLRSLISWFEATATSSSRHATATASVFVKAMSAEFRSIALRMIFPPTSLTSPFLCTQTDVQNLLEAASFCADRLIPESFRQRAGRSVPPSSVVHWKACFGNFLVACLAAVVPASRRALIRDRSVPSAEWGGAGPEFAHARDQFLRHRVSQLTAAVATEAAATKKSSTKAISAKATFTATAASIDAVLLFIGEQSAGLDDGVPALSATAFATGMLNTRQIRGRDVKLAERAVVDTSAAVAERTSGTVAAAMSLLARATWRNDIDNRAMLRAATGRHFVSLDAREYFDPYFGTGSSTKASSSSSSSSAAAAQQQTPLPPSLHVISSVLSPEAGADAANQFRRAILLSSSQASPPPTARAGATASLSSWLARSVKRNTDAQAVAEFEPLLVSLPTDSHRVEAICHVLNLRSPSLFLMPRRVSVALALFRCATRANSPLEMSGAASSVVAASSRRLAAISAAGGGSGDVEDASRRIVSLVPLALLNSSEHIALFHARACGLSLAAALKSRAVVGGEDANPATSSDTSACVTSLMVTGDKFARTRSESSPTALLTGFSEMVRVICSVAPADAMLIAKALARELDPQQQQQHGGSADAAIAMVGHLTSNKEAFANARASPLVALWLFSAAASLGGGGDPAALFRVVRDGVRPALDAVAVSADGELRRLVRAIERGDVVENLDPLREALAVSLAGVHFDL